MMGPGPSVDGVRTCPSCRGHAAEGATRCPHCAAALPAMRFRLAPTTPEGALPPSAPAPAPPRAPAPAPARASASATSALVDRLPPRLREHRVFVAAGIVLVLLLAAVGGGVYATSAEARYPEGYLLEEKELPAGVRNAQLPSFVLAELGVDETPGQIDPAQLEQFETDAGLRPAEGWLQVLGASSASPDVFLFAFRFDSREDAGEWLNEARDTCLENDGGRLFQDRSVVVLLAADSDEDLPVLAKVAAALQDESPRLARVC